MNAKLHNDIKDRRDEFQIKPLFLLLFVILNLLLSNSTFAGDLSWKVVNRFPLFKQDAAFSRLEQEWQPEESAESFLSRQNTKTLRGGRKWC